MPVSTLICTRTGCSRRQAARHTCQEATVCTTLYAAIEPYHSCGVMPEDGQLSSDAAAAADAASSIQATAKCVSPASRRRQARPFHGAVAVGVGLDDGHHDAVFSRFLAQIAVILFYIIQTDTRFGTCFHSSDHVLYFGDEILCFFCVLHIGNVLNAVSAFVIIQHHDASVNSQTVNRYAVGCVFGTDRIGNEAFADRAATASYNPSGTRRAMSATSVWMPPVNRRRRFPVALFQRKTFKRIGSLEGVKTGAVGRTDFKIQFGGLRVNAERAGKFGGDDLLRSLAVGAQTGREKAAKERIALQPVR